MRSFRYFALKLSLVIVTGLAVAFWMQPPTTVYAQGPTLDVSKDFGSGATVLNIDSGVQFTYFINYRCASALNHCVSTTVTDVVPSELQILSTAAPPNHIASVDIVSNTVTFNFVDPLPAGSTGVLEIRVMFPPGTIPGTSVVNNATSHTDGGTVTTNNTTATVQGQFEMYAQKTENDNVENGVVGPFNTTYLLQICSPDSEGGVRLLNPEVTDPLPPEADYVSSSPAGTYDSGTHTVTWTYASNGGTLPDAIEVGGCYDIELVVHLRGNPGDTITNSFSVDGDPEDGSTPPAIEDTHTITLAGPTSSGSFVKTSTSPSTYSDRPTEEFPGGQVTYNIAYANTGTVTHTNVVITDTVPPSHTITSITVNPIIDPVNAYYELNHSGTWTAFPNNAYNIATTVTITDLGVAGDQITGIRWELGTVPYNAPGWTGGFVATLDPALAPGTTLTNYANLGAVNANDGSPLALNSDASVTIIDNAGRAIPRPTKAVDSGPYLPGEVMDITLTASNDAVAHNPVDGPIFLADLLSQELEIVVLDTNGYRPALITDTWYTLVVTDGVTTPPTATLTTVGTQTLAKWEWGPSYHQQPGHSVEVQFKARVKDGTLPQTIYNRADLMWGDTTTNPLQCEGDQVYTDTLDLDGDGNTTETGCQTSPQPIQINVFLAMDSEKFVWGQLDTDWNKLGWTVPGGNVDWKMVVTNTSNVSTTNLVVYDILPYIGDTGVIATNENRGSIWRPNMQAPVSAPSGIPLTISYSKSQNPCRTEIVPSGPAGCVDDWTTTFPGDATSVQAIKLDFCDSSGTNCLVLDADDGSGNGGVVTFTWHMVAPNGAPRGATNIAWNSFGFTAEGGSIQLLPAEPIRVGIRLTDTVTPYDLGDYVWLDVVGQQNDGIQQPEETGINGVRVELYDSAGNFIDYRITGPDHTGNPGYYLFTDIPGGNYYLRFFTPLSSTLPYTFSIPNNGGDDAVDSDGEIPGTDATYGPYLQTATFGLITDTMTWDQGLWLPTDYGDAPQDNSTWNYPVMASLSTPAAQAGRHIISPTIYLGNSVDAELDGQQTTTALGDDTTATPDDEDGVQFEYYLGTIAQPTGVMILGENHTLSITATSPFTTSYLNAWIDFNRDGDWDDAGEHIITDNSSTGNYTVNVPVPTGASPGTTYARFRYSTQQGLTPYLTAPDGEVEDYRVVLVNLPEKSLVTTSEAHTTGADLAIGEIARYRLVIPIPEGTMPNFTVTDHLPPGLQFLDDGTATVSFTGTNVTSTTFTISGAPFGDGTDPVFSLGTVTNGDTDADEEDVVIEFNALVLNTTNNNNGDSLDNDFTVTYDTFSATSNVVTVNIVEPNFNISKSVTTAPNDVGDTVVYQIDVTGAVTTAFDLLVTDTLDADLALDSIGVTAPAYATVDTTNTDIPNNYVEVGFDFLHPGDTATIMVTATVQTAVPVGQTIPNTATLVYSSLPLTGTVGNPTDSNTPGNTGDTDGERNGSGGVNDHNDVDRVDVDLAQPSILKTVTPTEYTIGDLITYTMRITLPEGTTQGLAVVDDIPAGQAYQSSAVISTAVASNGDLANDFNGTLPAPTVTALGGDGADVTFDFGDTDTVEDNDGSNNTFLIQVTTAVLDASGNRDGLSIDNIANLNYTRNGAPATISDTAAITIAEPVLHIGKTYVTPPGCGATLYLENFNDNLAQNWNSTNAWSVNNGIYGTTSSGLSAVGDTAWTDYSYSFMMRTTDDDGQMGAYIRQQGGTSSTGYLFRWTNAGMSLGIPGQPALANANGGYQTNHWYHVEMRAVGNTIEVYVDGVLVLSGTDNTYSTGRVGLYSNQLNPAQFDDVLVTKMDDIGCYIGANQLVTYTLFISNQWTLPGYDLVITDDLPISTTLVGYTFSSDDGAAVVTAGPSANATGTVTWDVSQLTNESPFTGLDHPGITITVVVQVDDGVPANTILPSQVWLAYDGQQGTGPVGIQRDYSGGSHSTALRTVDAGLAKTVTFSPQPTATLGTLVTYTIVAPSSPITATLYGVVITDQLQLPQYFVENVNATGGTNPVTTFDQTSGLITATFDSIPHDTQATITVTARISHEFPSAGTDPNGGDIITNSAVMSHTTSVTESNVVSTDVHEPRVSISKSAAVNGTDPRAMDYTVTVVNNGDADAFSLNVTDATPDGTTVSNIGQGGALLSDNRTISWTISSLAIGASQDLTYRLTLSEAIYATNLFTNTAIVTNTSLTDTIPGVRPYVTDTVHTFPLPMGRIGDYVWLDDYSGIQGTSPATETGIANVIVNLYDITGTLIATTTTNANGLYIFEHLPLSTTYVVQLAPSNFNIGEPLEPYTTTQLNVSGSTPANDSDANPDALFGGNGYAITTTLTAAITEDLSLDYGFIPLMSLGNQVWWDRNDNGHLDAGESTFDGVAVELYQDTNGDGIFSVGDTLLDSAITAGGGYYTFTNLYPSIPTSPDTNYLVVVTDTNFIGAGVLVDYLPSSLVDDGNSDRNNWNHGSSVGNVVASTDIALTVNSEPTDDGDSDNNSNLTIDFGFYLMDLGDLPDIYGTLIASDGARHLISPTLYLGARVDVESDGQPSINVEGDDNTDSTSFGAGAGDDEDGVTWTQLVLGQTATFTVTASSNGGYLNGWIDFNGNNAFDAGEQVFTDVALSTGINSFPVAVPVTATLNSIYMRFRYSTQTGLTSTGQATDGEVEDYVTTAIGYDLGDLPDSYQTTLPLGARHVISDGLYLGTRVDAEGDGQPSVDALGDDNVTGSAIGAGIGDDEDGVSWSTLTVGQSAVFTITASQNNAYLNAWIDFDGDGDFTLASDHIINGALLNTGVNIFSIPIPLTTTTDNLYMRFRYSTSQTLSFNGLAPDGEVEDYVDSPIAYDFGDLPDPTFPTLLASDGARHIISSTLFLGALVDAEVDGQPSSLANGDDIVGTPDDEDGVTWGALIASQITTFTVTASQNNGYLNGWIDFNGNGTFDTGEQVFTDTLLSVGANNLTVNVPANVASNNNLYMRFRYSTQQGLAPTGEAIDGEVEDYVATLAAYDLGDLPDHLQGASSYPTLLVNSGARHIISPTLYLGARVDAELDGQPSLLADGDDHNPAELPDDEDGVTWTPLVLGQTATFTVNTTSVNQGYLNGWIDFNGNGVLDDAGEQVISGALLNSGDNTFAVTIPATATAGNLYMRFRYSSQQTLAPTGDAPDGEVEDYVAQTVWYDLGDLPDGYGTLVTSTGARHLISPTLYLGNRVDAEGDGQPSINADGDDTNPTTTFGTAGTDDEDGVSWSTLELGQTAIFTVTSASTGAGLLNGWIDFNGDGDFADVGEQIFTDSLLGTGTLTTSATIPLTATTGALYMRFRYSTQTQLSPTGDAFDGEVEDYAGQVIVRDYGDLPEPTYPTTLANNGARHIILTANNPTLGATVDDEVDGQPNATATGDDIARTPDDEDGVQLMTPLVAGQVATFTISATNTTDARLSAWMDFNGDGDFADAGEQIFNNILLSAGANTLNITVPTIILSDTINARFRYSTQQALAPTGEATDGEVEDYQFAPTRLVSLGDLVWFDYNNNGIYESGAGEIGVSGTTVELYNAGDTAGTDTPVDTVTTDANGRYLFTDIPEGGYFVHIPPSQFTAGQPLYGYDSSMPTQADPNTDQNENVDENGIPVSGTADVAGVSSGVVTVTVGLEPTGDDVNNIDPTTPDASSNLTVDFGFYPANPGITVVKEVGISPNVNHATVRYTITVTNSGQIELFPVVLTDTLPAELTYADNASPAEPDSISGQTLGWDNIVISPLQPGQSTQVSFNAQITAGYTGTFVNVVTGTGVYTGGVITDTSSVPIEVRDPAIDLTKTIVPPGAVNGVITYTIIVTNSGASELDVIPLFDYYDPTYLTFTVSTPAEDYRASGEIRWNDLTQSFGRNLMPGEHFVVTTTFGVIREITQTVNSAVVSGTTDIYVNPAPPITDTATITNTPTAVDLLYFNGAENGNGDVVLQWATASEINNYAFFVYRGESANRDDALDISGGLAAQGVGGGGANYTFTDANVDAGKTYHYWLADMDNSGIVTWHPPFQITITADGGIGADFTHWVYLPLIVK